MNSAPKRPVRRLAIFIALLVVVVVLAAPLPIIAALVWHWTHGETITVESHVVPVPQGWIGIRIDSPQRVSIVRMRAELSRHLVTISSVDVNVGANVG